MMRNFIVAILLVFIVGLIVIVNMLVKTIIYIAQCEDQEELYYEKLCQSDKSGTAELK